MNFLVQSDMIQSLLRTATVTKCLFHMIQEFSSHVVADPNRGTDSVRLIAHCVLELFRGFIDRPQSRRDVSSMYLLCLRQAGN